MLDETKKENIADNNIILRTAFGGIASIAEVLISHPLWALKIRKQCGYYFTLNPTVLYKGITPHVVGEVLIGSFQVGMEAYFSKIIEQSNNKREKFPPFKIFSSFLSGAISAVIINPIELLMTHQQKHHFSVYETYSKIICKPRLLLYGFSGTSIRESLFVMGYLGIPPIIKHKIEACSKDKLAGSSASIISGLISGGLLSIVSHPIDTVRSIQHDKIYNKPSMKATAISLYQSCGIRGFFSGLFARTARISIASTVMFNSIETMESFIKKSSHT